MSQKATLERIKVLILEKTRIENISPSDCKVISHFIHRETQKTISETTLKRLFGFAETKSKFSAYTVNTLLEYSQKPVDNPKINHNEVFNTLKDEECLQIMHSNALQVTKNTVNHIKNRSTLPFEFTVARSFIPFDFEYFYSSNYTFTCFTSQAGYGKSIMLAHLAEQFFLNEEAKYKNDIILFLNAIDIFNSQFEYINIEDRIKQKLGINAQINLRDYFLQKNKTSGTKLIIIIDDFPELAISKISKVVIFDKLINLISSVGDGNHIKLIYSMRSTMWNRFYDKIKNIPFLKGGWFSGSYFNMKDHSNMPPLTADEINEVLKRMYPASYHKIDEELKSKLRFPFYLHWYYQLNEELPEFSSFTKIIFLEIIDRFIQEKIYLSKYAAEKIFICKKIVQLTRYKEYNLYVLKSELIKDISVFKNAYIELLSDGILTEEKEHHDGFTMDFVRFVQPQFFDHFLFVDMLEDTNNQINEDFFAKISKEHFDDQVKLDLLRWSIKYAINRNLLGSLNYIFNLKLSSYEKNYLVYFISKNLIYKKVKEPQFFNNLNKEGFHESMKSRLVHFDFADSYYKEAVAALIKLSDNNDDTLLYHALLAISDCLSLDKELITKRLQQMHKFSKEAKSWEVNPIELLRLVYFKIAGEFVYSNETLIKIEDFKQGERIFYKSTHDLPSNEQMVIFVMFSIVNVFYGNNKEAIQIVNAMITHFPKSVQMTKSYASYIFTTLVYFKSKTPSGTNTEAMETIKSRLFAYQASKNTIPFIQSIFLAAQAYQSKNDKDYNCALIYAKRCLEIFKRNNLIVNQICILNLLISIYQELNEQEIKTEYINEKLSVLEQRKIAPSLFHFIAESR